jgi:cytochrome c oxidase assembly factor CtaG
VTVSTWFTTWQFAPAVSAGLALAAAGYLTGAWHVGRRHPARPWPAVRTAAFLLGLAVIAVATQGGVAVYDDVLFSAHMAQHLMLIMVAPPLLIFGRPVTLLLHAARNPVHTRVKRVLRSRPVSFLTRPLVVFAVYAVVVAGTHLTPLLNLARENSAVHDAEHALYLVAGYLYFLAVVGSEPVRRLPVFGRYLLLLGTMPVDTVVGVILMLAPPGMFPAYSGADLHRGGLVMFAGSDLIMAGLAIMLAVAFVRAGERDRASGDLDAYNASLSSLRAPRLSVVVRGNRLWLWTMGCCARKRERLLPNPSARRPCSRARRPGDSTSGSARPSGPAAR